MTLRPPDPKSGASASSATFACAGDLVASDLRIAAPRALDVILVVRLAVGKIA